MQLLAVKNVYDEKRDCLNTSFRRLVKNPPDGFVVLEGNAGLGADWPAAIWKSTQALAVALAVFSAPATIKENWPLWKENYDQAVEQMMNFHGEVRIDRDSAQMIAMHHAVEVLGMNPAKLTIHMAIRHFRHFGGHYQDLLADGRVDMSWPKLAQDSTAVLSDGVRSTEEAAKQAVCRYVFGIDDSKDYKTIVVERDGRLAFFAEL